MIKPMLHQFGDFKGYYIPLKDVLQMLIMKEDITPFVLQSVARDKSHMTSFTCGEIYQSLSKLKIDGHLLLIHLYNDEFEVVNPIDAKRGKHNMNATYFTLGNLPSKYRSQLQHIYLTNIVKHKAVTSMGYAAAFAPLVAELEKLYTEGFNVKLTDGRVEKFYVIPCTVSGDKLFSHGLAGFRQVSTRAVCVACALYLMVNWLIRCVRMTLHYVMPLTMHTMSKQPVQILIMLLFKVLVDLLFSRSCSILMLQKHFHQISCMTVWRV
jgi:hypothetical protein